MLGRLEYHQGEARYFANMSVSLALLSLWSLLLLMIAVDAAVDAAVDFAMGALLCIGFATFYY